MGDENILFSLFTNIKDRITSFFSSASYSSKQGTQKLITNIDNKFYNSTEEKNNITYLMKKRGKRISKYFNKQRISKEYNHSISLKEDSNISIRLSELSSQEEINYDETESNLSGEYDHMLSISNNYIDGELDFKNNYRNNYSFLGQKNPRNFFNENFYNMEEDENNSNLNNNDILPEIIKDKMINSEYRKSKKHKKRLIKKSKASQIKQEINYKDVKRISHEYSSYKAKLKFRNKINNNFLQQIKNSEEICINKVNKNARINETNKLPFDNLTFTHPERFSFYSTQKKLKLEKNISKKNKKPNLFSITVENDINIIPSLNKNELKSLDKNSGVLNIFPVKSCESFGISNLNKDFTFGESRESNKSENENNLSKLINENNNGPSNSKEDSLDKNNKPFNNESKNNNNSSINKNFNGISFSSNNNFNSSNSQDYFMDVDECYLNKSNKKQNTNKKEKENNKHNIFPITSNNNPFLTGNKTNENNKNNSNFSNSVEYFKGKNFFNINGNNNNGSNAFNFSFGKA